MSRVLIECQYLPPIAWFAAVARSRQIIIERHEHYEKQTYRNRCYINAAHGREAMVIPITGRHGKPRISEVRIDYSQRWLNNHWRTIQAAYGKAPFFEYFSPELHDELFRKPALLYDLNMSLLTLCLKWLRWNVPIIETESYEETVPDDVTDLRSAITPKKGDATQTFYRPAVYYQVFGNKFVENLSLIDVVFCEGPGASEIVLASSPK